MTNRFERSDVVTAQTRKGPIDCVVVRTRRITRGRSAGMIEYTLAPLGKLAGDSYLQFKGERYLQPARKRYTKEQIREAMRAQTQVEDQRAEQKQERADRGRAAIGDMVLPTGGIWGPLNGSKIAVGDKVLVRGRGCPNWIATVGKINFSTGKVGIVRSARQDDPFADLLATALRGRPKRRQQYRWIHPDAIIKVMRPEEPLPFKLRASDRKAMDRAGWVQRTFGHEFIERSYVVARDPDNARKGQNYECASDVVKYDPDAELYWRATGSFD